MRYIEHQLVHMQSNTENIQTIWKMLNYRIHSTNVEESRFIRKVEMAMNWD